MMKRQKCVKRNDLLLIQTIQAHLWGMVEFLIFIYAITHGGSSRMNSGVYGSILSADLLIRTNWDSSCSKTMTQKTPANSTKDFRGISGRFSTGQVNVLVHVQHGMQKINSWIRADIRQVFWKVKSCHCSNQRETYINPLNTFTVLCEGRIIEPPSKTLFGNDPLLLCLNHSLYVYTYSTYSLWEKLWKYNIGEISLEDGEVPNHITSQSSTLNNLPEGFKFLDVSHRHLFYISRGHTKAVMVI